MTVLQRQQQRRRHCEKTTYLYVRHDTDVYQAASQYSACRCSLLQAGWHGLCVGLSVTVVSPAKTAEPIELPFGLWTRVTQGSVMLHVGAHSHHVLNKMEPSMCGGDAAFLSNYFDHCCCAHPHLTDIIGRQWKVCER